MPTFYVNHDGFDGCICLTLRESEFAEMFAAGLRLLHATVTNTPVWSCRGSPSVIACGQPPLTLPDG